MMEKKLSYEYKGFYSKLLSKAIRNKIDIAKIILFVCQIILSESSDESYDGIIISIKKNSRVFFKENDKYLYSLAFPFTLILDERPLIYYGSGQIDSKILNILNYLLKDINNFLDIYRVLTNETLTNEVLQDFDFNDCNFIYDVFLYLLFFDDGYIRYEEDIFRADEDFHPLFHFDFCYQNSSTYKIGLYEKITIDKFQEILDVKRQCWYMTVKKNHK